MKRPGPARFAAFCGLLLVLLLTGACTKKESAAAGGSSADSKSAVPDDAPVVTFLGDSITAGLHLAKAEAFPAVLAEMLAEAGKPFRPVNAGVSGDTTSGGLARLEWLLSQHPDILVIELGANDGMRGIGLDLIEKNLRAIAERAEKAGVRPLLLGMRLPPNYGLDYARGFAELYDRIAADMRLAYVPYFMKGVAGEPGKNLEDGIHPTAEGHRILARNIREGLEALLP